MSLKASKDTLLKKEQENKEEPTEMMNTEEFVKTLFANGSIPVDLPPDFWITVLASLTHTCDITAEFVHSKEFADAFEEEDPEKLNYSVIGPFLARALLVEVLVKQDILEENAIEDMGMEKTMWMIQQAFMTPLQGEEISC